MASPHVNIVVGVKNEVARGLRAVTNQLESFRRRVFSLQGAVVGIGGGVIAKSFIDAAAGAEKTKVLLEGISKDAKLAEKDFQWLLDFGEKNAAVGSLQEFQQAFVRLKVAGLDPAKGSLQSLVDAVAAFGGGSDDLQKASVAIFQMAGKGAINMEELRQQLGERIPTAVKIMARELGITEAQLNKLTENALLTGKYATNAIQALFRGFSKEYSGAANRLGDTWNGVISKILFKWKLFQLKVMETRVFSELKASAMKFLDWLNSDEGILQLSALAESTAVGFRGAVAAVDTVADSLRGVISVWNALPSWMAEAGGMGLLGGMLFGPTGGLVVATLTFLNGQLDRFSLSFQSLKKSYDNLNTATNNIGDVFSGKRDWWSGEWKGREAWRNNIEQYKKDAKAIAEEGIKDSWMFKGPEVEGPKVNLSGLLNKDGANGEAAAKKLASALKEAKGWIDELTLSATELEKKRLDQHLENLSGVLGKDHPAIKELKELVRLESMTLIPEAELEKMKQLKDNWTLKDEGMIEANRRAQEILEDRAEMIRSFSDEYKRATLSAYEYEKRAIDQQYRDLLEAATDNKEEILRVEEWYEKKKMEISKEGTDGAKRGFKAFAEQAKEVGSDVENAVTGAFSNMTDALANFVATGKMNFSDFANSIISDMARIVIQSRITGPLAGALGSGLDSLFKFGGGGGNGVSEGSMAGNPFGRATGGPVEAGRTYLVGERGPEILRMDGSGGYIWNNSHTSKNPKGGTPPTSAPKVTVNVINESGQQMSVSRQQTEQVNWQEMVVTLWLDALDRNRFGLKDVMGGI